MRSLEKEYFSRGVENSLHSHVLHIQNTLNAIIRLTELHIHYTEFT